MVWSILSPMEKGGYTAMESPEWTPVRSMCCMTPGISTSVPSETRIDTGRRSGSLSQEAERSHRRIIAALERQKALAGQTVDSQTGFAAVKADFDQMVQGLKAQAKTAGEMLNNLFAFCEEVFPEGQELLILVTELTINYYAATFISRYGCDAYFTHNQELLFYERQQEIISQLESLELN